MPEPEQHCKNRNADAKRRFVMETAVYKLREFDEKDVLKQGKTANPGLFYPEISCQDMGAWRRWLPKPYTHKFDLMDYNFPEEILEEFKLAKRISLFTGYEIRTSDIYDETYSSLVDLPAYYRTRAPNIFKQQDSILIGWAGGKAYFIARWGENLRPLGEIKTCIRKAWEVIDKNDLRSWQSFLIPFAISLPVFLSLLYGVSSFWSMIFTIFISTLYSFMVGVLSLFISYLLGIVKDLDIQICLDKYRA